MLRRFLKRNFSETSAYTVNVFSDFAEDAACCFPETHLTLLLEHHLGLIFHRRHLEVL